MGGTGRDHPGVGGLVHRHDSFFTELVPDVLDRRPAHPRVERRVSQERHGTRGHAVEILGRMEKPGDAILDHFRQSADVRRHDRDVARHRLERGQAEALLRRRQQEHVGRRQQRNHQLLRAEHVRPVRDAELTAEPMRRRDFRAVAHQQQPRRQSAG